MKDTITLSILLCAFSMVWGQTKILPGNKLINPGLIHQGNFNMTFYHSDVTQATELGSYEADVQIKEGKFYLNTYHKAKYYEEKNIVVADANNLKAISRKSSNLEDGISNEFFVGNGVFTNVKTGKKTNYDTKTADEYFDYNIYPYILSALPLKLGGENYVLPIIDVDHNNKVTTDEAIVLETKTDQFTSPLTGQHMCWKLTVVHKNAKKYVNYYIDKNNRRIRKIEHLFTGKVLGFLDKETDINLFKTPFDKEAIRKMMNDGSSTILGEAWAKDDVGFNDNRKLKFNVVNFAKKQFAPKGTKILLIPHTAYYKEWFELNKKQAKVKGTKQIPLPKEAASQIKTTEVFDDKGNFEFSNLMPGEYVLYTAFGYKDTYNKSVVTGSADVYVNGSYSGTEVYTDVFSFNAGGNAQIVKTIIIKTNGETAKVKLKRD